MHQKMCCQVEYTVLYIILCSVSAYGSSYHKHWLPSFTFVGHIGYRMLPYCQVNFWQVTSCKKLAGMKPFETVLREDVLILQFVIKFIIV